MQTHLAIRTLKSTTELADTVQVIFAVEPVKKAVLFIHGFSGDPITTWSDFHTLAPEEQKFRGVDLYFYGYDGLYADMVSSAAIFREFLERFFTETATLVKASLPQLLPRDSAFEYDEFMIVAHSLGSVIARRALADATQSGLPWVQKTKLVLFAPAHMGARAADLASEVATSYPSLRIFGAGARYESPLIDQLKSNSPELTQLQTDTKALMADPRNAHLKAHRVVLAEKEKIVFNVTFPGDPPPKAIRHTPHTSVCKPRPGFAAPLEHVKQCL